MGALVGGLHAEQGKGNGNGNAGNGNGNGNGNGSGAPAPAFEDTIDSFAADLTIRHAVVATDGSPVGSDAPAYTLRLERQRNGASWRTAISLRNLDRPSVVALNGPRVLDNPFIVSRLEYDDDGTAPRMYDAQGRRVTGPTDADRRRLGVADALRKGQFDPTAILGRMNGPGRGPDSRTFAAGLIVGAADGPKRRGNLEQRYGPRAGKVRGLDQFIRKDGAEVHELLASPDSSLPVELNQTNNGRLVSHAQFEYQPFNGNGIARSRVHSERALADGTRSVSDVSVANITVNQGGPR
jgi:hypothetical protein